MKRYHLQGSFLLISLLLLLLIGCSSGDDGIEGSGLNISGTAATGNAISNAALAAKSLSGTKSATTTGATGKYSFEINAEGPILFKVDIANGKSLYSIASASGTTNIHPFTDLIIRNWFEVQNLDIDAEFSSNTAITRLPTNTEINAIQATVKQLLAQALQAFNLPNDLDLFSTEFDANSTGFDLFLDFSQVVIINNNINIVLTDPTTNIDIEIVTEVALNTDLAQNDTTNPSTPENLRAFPISESEIILVWNPASDDIGVTGYNVYRNSIQVATTPYPVFTDTGLTTNTEYCYEVEAFDSAGNLSPSRVSISTNCPETSNDVDNTAPAAPTTLQAIAVNIGPVELSWTHENESDVTRFNVYRGSNGSIDTRIATVTSREFNDYNFSPATEYCYQTTAVDAAGNESARSVQSCVTTGGTTSPKPLGNSSLSFSVVSLEVTELQSVATLTVNRTGDIEAAISVDYSTTDGSATSEMDYNPANGTLIWGENDNSNRLIQIVVKPDDIIDDNETFSISLSNFSENAIAGDNVTSTVTITDAVCPGSLTASITESTTLSECTIVDGYIQVNDGTLTINPGVTLIFTAGSELDIRSTGSLLAKGSEAQPILFTGKQASPGYWDGIRFFDSNNVINELSYVTLEYGGVANDANLDMGSVNNANRIKINNTTLRKSQGYGFTFEGGTLVDDFSSNTITENTQGAGRLPANLVGALSTDSSYNGNDVDEIVVPSFTDITNAQTWSALNVSYSLDFHQIYADLAIEAGATLIFRAGGELDVRSSGSLAAIGTNENPILFTSAQTTAGYWDGIRFFDSNNVKNELRHVIIEYGGTENDANLDMASVNNANRIKISNTTLRKSQGYGFTFEGGTLVDSFSSNTITENTQGPAQLPANLVGELSTDSSYNGNGVDEIVVPSFTDVLDEQTWAALNVPYSLDFHQIYADLAIEAGATLIFRAGGELDVRSTGSLSAIGSNEKPILFTSEQTTAGYWDGIRFFDSNNIKNELSHVTIEYGGTQNDANLDMASVNNTNRIKISNSIFRNSLGYGVNFEGGTVIDGFSENVITLNEQGPVNLPINLVGKLDEATDYSGNTIDKIDVRDFTDVTTEQTWSNINVPLLLDTHDVTSNLTIEPGVILEFRQNGVFDVRSTGSLSAIGTADLPILFTSTQQTAGYWNGIEFSQSDNPQNSLDFVTVEFGGGGTTDGANIEFFGNGQTRANITNSTMKDSSGWGIILDENTLINDQSSNVFVNNFSGDIFTP